MGQGEGTGIEMWEIMRDVVGHKYLPFAHQRIESKLLFILLVEMKPIQVEHVPTEITATVSKQWLGNDVKEKIPFSVWMCVPAPRILLEIHEKNSKYKTGNTQVSMAYSFLCTSIHCNLGLYFHRKYFVL